MHFERILTILQHFLVWIPDKLFSTFCYLYSLCAYGFKKGLISDINFLFLRGGQGLSKTLFRINFGCLVRVGAPIKNSQNRQKRQKLPNFELLPRLPQAKGHPFYFYF